MKFSTKFFSVMMLSTSLSMVGMHDSSNTRILEGDRIDKFESDATTNTTYGHFLINNVKVLVAQEAVQQLTKDVERVTVGMDDSSNKRILEGNRIDEFEFHARTNTTYAHLLNNNFKVLVAPEAVQKLTEDVVQASNRQHARRYAVLSLTSGLLAGASFVAQINGYNDPKVAKAQAALVTTSVITGLSAIDHARRAHPEYTVSSIFSSLCNKVSFAGSSVWNAAAYTRSSASSAASSVARSACNTVSYAGSSVLNLLQSFSPWKKSCTPESPKTSSPKAIKVISRATSLASSNSASQNSSRSVSPTSLGSSTTSSPEAPKVTSRSTSSVVVESPKSSDLASQILKDSDNVKFPESTVVSVEKVSGSSDSDIPGALKAAATGPFEADFTDFGTEKE